MCVEDVDGKLESWRHCWICLSYTYRLRLLDIDSDLDVSYLVMLFLFWKKREFSWSMHLGRELIYLIYTLF